MNISEDDIQEHVEELEESEDAAGGNFIDSSINCQLPNTDANWFEIEASEELFPLTCSTNHEIVNVPVNCRSLLDFYLLFVDDEILEFIVTFTNLYAAQLLQNLTTCQELKKNPESVLGTH
ncbi:hypothetical protein HHI36_015427 [Cryptolaemus montrouzieri]|uniref:Uncharacterized protein n=1 Tax=Cryptolaemus montrouzieri TaxID=559131 RepID=A0ABD2N6W0_9CUCU